MQKNLRSPLKNYWKKAKRRIKAKLRTQRYRTIHAISSLVADLITNTVIIVGLLLVIFLTAVTLSFSLSIFLGSHVLGFLGATICLSLVALGLLWQRPKVERYFAGLTITRYFEKIKEKR
ncbi:hypothetical protein [Pedobacter chitinilyticus]|uniref:Phage holin family protein n=1 Tax=Pedobacter chitinilyticus TaxID=2233776 RepID=A0A443Z2Z3_9SPHI|nr:hypothetical protein [Pedobacter chitinilyticus]RWU10917.1 hypothetical protein DPV69_06195 [Pedobacter chitinilyticus]